MNLRPASIKGWAVAALLLGTAVYALAEDITLMTYYPSPRGVYQELRVGGGGPFPTPVGALHVIKPTDVPDEVAFRVDNELGGANPFVIDQAGNVGIGTAAPAAKLHVAGTPGTDGIRFPDGTLQTTASPFTNMEVFTSNGTFSIPSGGTKIMVDVWGGGGGGGGGYTAGGFSGGGGGGGGFGRGIFTVSPGDSHTVTVGAGGAGAPPWSGDASAGSDGTASSFGALISAGGGSGGKPHSQGGVGGLGGTSTAAHAVTGGVGGGGTAAMGGVGGGGMGGSAGAGGPGGGGGSGNSAGSPGSAPGGGGGGGGCGNSTPGAGGAGGAGRVIVHFVSDF